MGKTVPSATQLVKLKQKELSEFRKALRKEDRQILDRLFSYAKKHSQAIGNAPSVYPMEIILFGILIEIEKQIQRIKDEIPDP
ncbi:hypothetical protein [Persephonella sp.]|uniref:hypothetical protein n=1 Tax=Persephonella sp. TaxID=2060922 RepID=UPI0025E1127F|nr:hypothetical protein [Persephonella sp.]